MPRAVESAHHDEDMQADRQLSLIRDHPAFTCSQSIPLLHAPARGLSSTILQRCGLLSRALSKLIEDIGEVRDHMQHRLALHA